MFIDWLKSFRGRNLRARRPGSRLPSSPTPLEPRTLLSATAIGGALKTVYGDGKSAVSSILTSIEFSYTEVLKAIASLFS